MNALSEKHKKNTQIFFYILSLFAVTALLWMFLFNIDIISNAEGQVIPAGDVKTIQHLEGGIIDQILVKESDIVNKDDPLVILAVLLTSVPFAVLNLVVPKLSQAAFPCCLQ